VWRGVRNWVGQKSWAQLALKHHPDKVRSGGAAGVESVRLALEAAAEVLFKAISRAHNILSNATERRRFDLIELHHQVRELLASFSGRWALKVVRATSFGSHTRQVHSPEPIDSDARRGRVSVSSRQCYKVGGQVGSKHGASWGRDRQPPAPWPFQGRGKSGGAWSFGGGASTSSPRASHSYDFEFDSDDEDNWFYTEAQVCFALMAHADDRAAQPPRSASHA
jgi:curved DNA-binding protein CbpA